MKIEDLPHDEAIKKIRETYGMGEEDAEFYLAIQTGQTEGDVIDMSATKANTGERLMRT